MASSMTAAEAARDSRWSTSELDGGLDAWMELLSERITEMQVGCEAPAAFSASWERYGLGPIDLNFLKAEPQRVQRTPAMIARNKAIDYDLLYMRHGPGDLNHCGVQMRVPEGSFVLLDNEEPYDLHFFDQTVCLTAHIEDSWLRKWVPHPKKLVARPIAGDADWGAPLAAMLLTISRQGLHRAALPRSVIADQFGAMLALMAGEPDVQATLYQGELLDRLKRIMRDQFENPELSPAMVAQAAGISKRHLHGIFAQSKTTFGAALMDMRLHRAAEMLADPRYRAYRVGDVAWSCGFSDPSHFARRFRERYGRAPLSFRFEGDPR